MTSFTLKYMYLPLHFMNVHFLKLLISWIFHCALIVGLSKVLGHHKSPEQYQCTLAIDPTSLSNCTGGTKRHSSERHSLIYFCVNVYLRLDRVCGFMGLLVFPQANIKQLEKQVLLILVSWSCHPSCELDSIIHMNSLLKKICRSQKSVFEKKKKDEYHGIRGWPKESEATEHFTKQSYACVVFNLLFLQWNSELCGFWDVFCFLLSLFCKFWCGSCDTAP